MPIIDISKKELERLLNKEIKIDDLENLLSTAKGQIEKIDADNIRIEIADRNRPDLLCIEGIVRQIKKQKLKIKDSNSYEIIVDPLLEKIRPYIAGFVVKNINIDDDSLKSIIQTQEKLADSYGIKRKNIAIGMYNMEKISFPIFYRAKKPNDTKFIPLGMTQKLTLDEILKMHPKGVAYGYILKDKNRFPFLEDKNNIPLSFPPIINSAITGEIKPGDNNIFCEVTGTNLNQVLLIINILAYNFSDRGGVIYPCKVKYPYKTNFGKEIITPFNFNKKIKIAHREFEKLLGIKLTKEKIIEKLTYMDYEVKNIKNGYEVVVPNYRIDVMDSYDVIEDLAISFDYNKFEPAFLTEFTLGEKQPLATLIEKITKIIIGLGFEEIVSNVLTSMNEDFSDGVVEIENKVSDTYSVMRTSIIPCLLEVEMISSKASYPHKLFEIGEIVKNGKTYTNLCATISNKEANFSDIHSYLDTLMYYLNLEYKIKKTSHNAFIQGRCANILVNHKPIGLIGEIHPQTLEKYKIKYPTAAFELSISHIANDELK